MADKLDCRPQKFANAPFEIFILLIDLFAEYA